MKLQSLQSSFSAFFKAAIAGCFAGARALQRMAGFRSRTACSVTHLRRLISSRGRGTAAALGLGSHTLTPPHLPPSLPPSPKGWEEKGFCVHGISVLGREGWLSKDSLTGSVKAGSGCRLTRSLAGETTRVPAHPSDVHLLLVFPRASPQQKGGAASSAPGEGVALVPAWF